VSRDALDFIGAAASNAGLCADESITETLRMAARTKRICTEYLNFLLVVVVSSANLDPLPIQADDGCCHDASTRSGGGKSPDVRCDDGRSIAGTVI
jgi:hypothetical protein